MKAINLVVQVLFFSFVLALTGCELLQSNTKPSPKVDKADKTDKVSEPSVNNSVNTAYFPVKVEIIPLTGFVNPVGDESMREINVYVSLLDSFGCQIKSPGVFRFEVYEHVQRSSEPKGKRIAIRPVIDLTDAAQNNKYWRDFLRAYHFNLPFKPADNRSYIMQVTFLCPAGKRLTGEFVLKRTQ
jgi:hypothetical protein